MGPGRLRGPGRDLHSGRDGDVHGHALIHWGDVVLAAPVVKNSNNRFLLALSNLKDASLSTPILADGPQFHQNPVTVHGIAHVGWGDKNIALQLAASPWRQRIRFRSDKA